MRGQCWLQERSILITLLLLRGLAVAAIGLVPSITLESAKVTAHSAGAKVSQHFAYNLNKSDVRALEVSPPDILLFTGGTDGGDYDHGLLNAKLLAQSNLECAIIYAGNRDLQDDVQEILGDKDLTIVDNVLPNLDSPNPHSARKAICDIFLHKIVKGKGLDVIVDLTGEDPCQPLIQSLNWYSKFANTSPIGKPSC